MPSYNEIDGVPSHANKWLLTDVLRGEWGFRGAITSDYSAIDQLKDIHHVAGELEQAARLALAAGVDMALPDGLSYRPLDTQVREGTASQAAIDQAVRYVTDMLSRPGLFENPFHSGSPRGANTQD